MIDLHTHSTHSDGTCTPTEVAELALRAGLRAVSLTDHDTTSSAAEMEAACAERGIEWVPGIELSLVDSENVTDRRGVISDVHAHVLVYWPPLDPAHPFQRRLEQIRAGRKQRNIDLLEVLHGAGFTDITFEDLVAEAKGTDNIGKPHIAKLMVERHPDLVHGATHDYYQPIYDDFIGDQGLYYIARETPPLDEMIALLRAHPVEGGRPLIVIAHPLRNYFGDASQGHVEQHLGALLARFKDRGVDGIEGYYGGFDEDMRRFVVQTTKDTGLLVTGGSDFHGTVKPGVKIAHGAHGVRVPDEVLEAMKAAR